jgi:hypothetical protein
MPCCPKKFSHMRLSGGTEVPQEILQLEQDFQTRMSRWQDETTIDMSFLQDLGTPLEQLVDLFTSIHIPSDATPSTHVEQTLSVLTTLLAQYESTFVSLTKARDTISALDSRHLLTQQRLTEFAANISKALYDIRSKTLKRNEDYNRVVTECQVMRNRLTIADRERRTQDELVLNMAKKLNNTEEMNLTLRRERKKLDLHVLQLKTHIEGTTDLFRDT